MRPAFSSRAFAAFGAMLCAVGLDACSGSGPAPASSSSASATDPSAISSVSPGSPVGTGPSPAVAVGPAAASPAASPGAGLAASPADPALALEALMGQHSVLAGDMMRARIRGDADLAQAANAALGQNTKALSEVLQPFVDAAARTHFEEMWGEHILALFEYARGHSIHDATVREHARKESVEYEIELADYFVDQSKGRLDRRAALSAVHAHAAHLLANADAYAAGRYGPAAQGYRESYTHSQGFGEALARALMPARVTATLDTPPVRLRSELTRLLGQHAALVMAMTRSAAGEPKDFTAMGQALDGNTVDLTAAIDALFGTAAAQRFQTLWADQVDQLAAYNTASVQRDSVGQQRARTALATFQTSLAGFLSSVTSGRLAVPVVVRAFADHDDRLLAEIDAYAALSFDQSYSRSEQIHAAMFTLSGQLAEGIGATVAARLPRGGSQTGGGGAATSAAQS